MNLSKNTSAESVGILGAGNWGTVLALLASKQSPKVYLYDRDASRVEEMGRLRENRRYLPGVTLPEAIEFTSDLSQVFSNCNLVLPVVPSSAFRTLAKQYAPFTRGDHLLVHGTKGLEPITHKRMSEILTEETCCLRVGALSGPNLALELAQAQPGATVVSSRFDEVIEATQAIFSSTALRVYGNHDLVGVEWAGALKNILAIAAGMLNELKLGQNALAMVLTRGIAEISRLISAMGAHSSTLLGLAGIGDIIATCTSPLSRNFRAGQMLAQGKTRQEIEQALAMTIEGLNTISVAMELAAQKRLDMPITTALWHIAFNQKPVIDAIRELMERPSTFEFTFQ
ncbi:MAG: NAD(P)H-dependent glycerol-3-phosphate dehydrogenase [Bdellovibrionota bacterium]